MNEDESREIQTTLRDALGRRAESATPLLAPPPEVVSAVRRRRALRAAGSVLGVGLLVGGVGVGVSSWARNSLSGGSVIAASSGGTVAIESLPLGPLAARRDATGVWTGSEFIVWGGWRGDQRAQEYFADGAAYNPTTRKWNSLAKSPLVARSGQAAVWTGREMVVWGGVGVQKGPGSGLSDGAAYDPTSDSWREIAASPVGARINAKALTVRGLVVLAGGYSNADTPAANSVLFYDPTKNSWSSVETSMPVYDAVVSSSGQVVVAGLAKTDGSLIVQAVTPGSEPVTLPPVPIPARPSRISLVADDSSIAVLSTDNSWTNAYLSVVGNLDQNLAQGRWTTKRLSPDDTVPNVDTSTLERGLAVRVSHATFLVVSSYGVSLIDLDRALASRVKNVMGDYCGASGAAAWTGADAILWGGETCSTTGSGVTDRGVVLRIK